MIRLIRHFPRPAPIRLNPKTMNKQTKSPRHRLTMLAAVASLLALPAAHSGDTFKWSVQYLVDNSQSVFGKSQKVWPRNNRGLAISPDGQFLYAGYNHGSNGVGEVRKIAIGISDDPTKATVAVLHGPLGKAIACDDKGRVYIANGKNVLVYDSNLSQILATIQFPANVGLSFEGVAVAREGNDLALYASNRVGSSIHRVVVEEKGAQIAGTKPAGFDGDGVFSIPNASDLRGIKVDSKGQIWVADHDGRVFRISKDGKDIKEALIPSAMDVAIEGNRAYVSRGTDRLVAVIEADSLNLLGNLAIPWDELELTPSGNNNFGALSGIVAIPGKGFFLSNESGQTAHQKSTYGKVDTNSDKVGGKVYRDAFLDDNDPILRALEVKE